MSAPQSVTANFGTIAVAPDVTAQLTISTGAPAFNRATGRFSQAVTIVNNGAALVSSAYVLDNLAAGYTMFAPNGFTSATAPVGSPYVEIGPLGAGGSITFTIQLTRTGTPALTYTPRVLGAGSR